LDTWYAGRTRPALLLIVLNMVAHFIPFERASLSPDDYASLLRSLSIPGFNLAEMMCVYPDRPLSSAVAMAQPKLFADGTTGPLVLLFLLSTGVLLATFALLRLVLRDAHAALLGAVVFGLLPNKLETYHGSVYVVVNLAILHYLLSFACFVQYVTRRAASCLLASLVFYTFGVFSYEVGYFAPLVFLVYCWLYDRSSMPRLIWFALPAVAYAGCRLWAVQTVHTVGVGQWRPLLTLLHQYAGGYLALTLLNSISGLLAMPWRWLSLAVLCDILILWILGRSMARHEVPAIGRREWWLALSVFALFLLPLFLQRHGGVAGRHLTLPSVGVAIAILGGLRWLGSRARPGLLGLVAAGLIVSQGSAWAQVVACRINQAVYEAMKEMRDPLEKARDVVIDVHSFRKAIPSSWVSFDYAFLNSYYGAQTLEDSSLRSMARVVSGDPAKPVHLAVDQPKLTEDGLLAFTEGKETGSRSFHTLPQALLADSTVVIDFGTVYGAGFYQGRRRGAR
jgi:hypothetical protein